MLIFQVAGSSRSDFHLPQACTLGKELPILRNFAKNYTLFVGVVASEGLNDPSSTPDIHSTSH